MLTIAQQEALGKIAQASVAAEDATACPAELSAAQCILESGWLSACPGNNCFGIKATDEHRAYSLTEEYLNGQWVKITSAWEVYPSLAACFTAHARLIQHGPYADAWRQYEQNHNLSQLMRGIAAFYATDPDYASKILSFSQNAHLKTALQYWRDHAYRAV